MHSCSTFQAVDGEPGRVLLRLLRVEGDAVEERLRVFVLPAVLDPELPHGLFVDVGSHDLARDARIVGYTFDHAPTPKLREPPDGVLRLRIVAVAGVENHVVRIVLLATVAVVVVTLEPPENEIRRTVD